MTPPRIPLQVTDLTTSLPAVHQSALMVEGGWRDFSFYHPDARVTANVATQKVAAEHITEKYRGTFVDAKEHVSVVTVLGTKTFDFSSFIVNKNCCS